MIDVCTFKWGDKFSVGDINALYRGVTQHYAKPFRFTAITDDVIGLDAGIRALPLWEDYSNVPNPSGPHKVSCYRRLRLFSPEASYLIGERIVCLDLDVVVCGDLVPLWARQEPVVFYDGQWGRPRRKRPWVKKQPYNGSMFMLTAGSRPQVWTRFDPARSPLQAFAAGYRGSDQGWFGYCLGDNEATWGDLDGVYSWRNLDGKIPSDAKLVFFRGNTHASIRESADTCAAEQNTQSLSSR